MNTMPAAGVPAPVVYTNKAQCRDCYRCLRACPVKAIRMHDGQASVQPERCIACGRCIAECPQGAKRIRSDLEPARQLLRENGRVAVSVAPSFAAWLQPWEQRRLPSALRRLGFAVVAETAVGAWHAAAETAAHVRAHPSSAHLCTACPAAVRYVELYRPEAAAALVPVVSPMIAHARRLKAGGARGAVDRVVFVGPCVAKKAEAQRPEMADAVDCVLTFAELQEWFDREDIRLAECEESAFDEQPRGEARYFPLPGGLARTAALATDLLAVDTLAVSGPEDVEEAIRGLGGLARETVVEPLFCREGCAGGPGMPTRRNRFLMRRAILDYAAAHPGSAGTGGDGGALVVQFDPETRPARTHSEDAILEVLRVTGKAEKEEQLNCGACGYASCRDKAIAVLDGMAEPEMCIPRMRRLAEQRTDRIIETSPNGIVILDERLRIIGMNAAFRRLFHCSDAVCGKPIGYLMDPRLFERVGYEGEELIRETVRHDNYNLVCHELVYALREERQTVGIFVNVTRSEADRRHLDALRAETVSQARDLLQHQVDMAQQLARLVGETTAQGEHLVRNLLELAGGGSEDQRSPATWDTLISR